MPLGGGAGRGVPARSLARGPQRGWDRAYFGSCPGVGSSIGKVRAPEGVVCGPAAGPTGVAEPLAEVSPVDDGAADAVWLTPMEAFDEPFVLLVTEVRKRRAVSSSLVTVPLMISDAITPFFL